MRRMTERRRLFGLASLHAGSAVLCAFIVPDGLSRVLSAHLSRGFVFCSPPFSYVFAVFSSHPCTDDRLRSHSAVRFHQVGLRQTPHETAQTAGILLTLQATALPIMGQAAFQTSARKDRRYLGRALKVSDKRIVRFVPRFDRTVIASSMTFHCSPPEPNPTPLKEARRSPSRSFIKEVN